ncbi:hypothetical protein FSP39_012100 [Pinctada imbricata]|uniref:Methyltransferase FkbM domain-containing protein n=1 Tax=Pinctada imbricata TaxID=66713 RepID=A0AA88YQY7_PINIB|nr:hypothetical protein FSP39_012100 [Pinctada imbricata]
MKKKYNRGIILVIVLLICTQQVQWFNDPLVPIYDINEVDPEFYPLLQACNNTGVPLQYEISNYVPIARKLNELEKDKISACLRRDLEMEHKNSWDAFFTNNAENIRWDAHTYLNSDSIVMEVGGNIGMMSDHIQTLYRPRKYIILEPIAEFYNVLVDKYADMSNIAVLNFGLASEDRTDFVQIDGGSTSRFLPNNLPDKDSEPLRQVNATDFFLSMAVGFFEVDLLTINCEGCEYEVLDSLLDSNLINNIHHVQISFHHINGLGNTLERWCQYQQLLSRTHRLMYQYPLFWESWARKDLQQ